MWLRLYLMLLSMFLETFWADIYLSDWTESQLKTSCAKLFCLKFSYCLKILYSKFLIHWENLCPSTRCLWWNFRFHIFNNYYHEWVKDLVIFCNIMWTPITAFLSHKTFSHQTFCIILEFFFNPHSPETSKL